MVQWAGCRRNRDPAGKALKSHKYGLVKVANRTISWLFSMQQTKKDGVVNTAAGLMMNTHA
jgi:hypothetical protein